MDEAIARQMAKIRIGAALSRIEGSAIGARLALEMVRDIDRDGLEAVLQDIEREIATVRRAAPSPDTGAP